MSPCPDFPKHGKLEEPSSGHLATQGGLLPRQKARKGEPEDNPSNALVSVFSKEPTERGRGGNRFVTSDGPVAERKQASLGNNPHCEVWKIPWRSNSDLAGDLGGLVPSEQETLGLKP